MTNDLSEMPDAELRALLLQSRQTLTALIESLSNRSDKQNAIRRLMSPGRHAGDVQRTGSQRAGPDAAGSAGQSCGAGQRPECGSGGDGYEAAGGKGNGP
jgi:hypothetical protein